MKIPKLKEIRDFYIEHYSNEVAKCKKWISENEPLKDTMMYQAAVLGMNWHEFWRAFWSTFKNAG